MADVSEKTEDAIILPCVFIRKETAREYKEFYNKIKPHLEALENNRRLYFSSKFRFDAPQ